MTFILEGSDLCFKTTIANKLNKALNWTIYRGNSFELAQQPKNTLFLYLYRLAMHDKAIIDRYFLSNLVYTDLYPGYTRLEDDQVKFLERQLQDKAIVIHLYANVDTLLERKKQRGEKDVADNMFQRINDGYIKYIANTSLEVWSYNTERMSSDEIVNDIVNRMNSRK